MTLKEAQKQWDDAIEMKTFHKAYSVTEKTLIDAATLYGKRQVKILFIKIGKTSSRIIFSEQGMAEENRQMALVPGTRVRMTGAEADDNQELRDTVFTVIAGPVRMGSYWVVWLDRYKGAYSCEFLIKTD